MNRGTMDKQIEQRLSHLLPELARLGIAVLSQREIPYGVQLRLQQERETAVVNLYYSEKKGLSCVVGAPARSPLKAVLEKLCQRPEQEPAGLMHDWQAWIGSDECGKGDYFGALVVAAFAADRSIEPELKQLGVTDSKHLKDFQIKAIAMKLYESYNDRIACVVLKPIKYNEIIADRKRRSENLNDLLAWQHGTAILELLKKQPGVQGILVDQFSRSQKVRSLLKDKDVKLPVVERPGAESDLAVAAASIIARYQFLQQHAAQSRYYKIKFPLGANHNVQATARDFIDKYGLKRLGEVAKLHFVTSKAVQQREIYI